MFSDIIKTLIQKDDKNIPSTQKYIFPLQIPSQEKKTLTMLTPRMIQS